MSWHKEAWDIEQDKLASEALRIDMFYCLSKKQRAQIYRMMKYNQVNLITALEFLIDRAVEYLFYTEEL